MAALVWGTIRILSDRNHALRYAEGNPSAPFGHANLDAALAEQNVWGYGQVITVALLILPFISFFEVIYGMLLSLVIMPPPITSVDPIGKRFRSNICSCIETLFVSATPRPQIDSPVSLHNTLYGPSQSYEDFYKYPWFHKINLLMYLLSLTIIGDILYFVSYYGQFSTAVYTQPIGRLARKYALWIGFNVAIVWIYTLLCVVLLKTVEAKHMENWQRMEEAQDVEELLNLHWIKDFHTGPKTLRFFSLAWYGMVLVIVGCSITYDVAHDGDMMLVL